MPQARALGRTTAGRTNRSLAIPRREDGAFQYQQPTTTQCSAAAPSSSAPTSLTTTQHLPPNPSLPNDSLSSTLLNPSISHSSNAASHFPRETLSMNRTVKDEYTRMMGSMGVDATTVGTARRHRSQHHVIEGVAPRRIPAHLLKQKEMDEAAAAARYQLAADRSVESEMNQHTNAATFSSSPYTRLHPTGSDPTPSSPSDFFPSTSTNFGEGSGVAGTKGQRWAPKNGMAEFLMRLHRGSGEEEGEESSEATAKPSTSITPILPSSLPSTHTKSSLLFNNIRPSTPSSQLPAPPVHARQVHQVSKPPPNDREQKKREYERDLNAVRNAMEKLGEAAGDYNQNVWFKGCSTLRDSSSISRETFLSVLPSLSIALTQKQKALLISLTFGEARRADYLTLLPRLREEVDYHIPELGRFLDYWQKLPSPQPKSDPNPTALHTLQQMKEYIETRGMNSFLSMIQFSSRVNLSHEKFQEQMQKSLNIHLPQNEMSKLLNILDPHSIGEIEYAQFTKLSEMNTHELDEGHQTWKGMSGSEQQQQQKGRGRGRKQQEKQQYEEEQKESVNDTFSSTAPITSTVVPRLSFPSQPQSISLVPPLFQSVQSARTQRVPRLSYEEVDASRGMAHTARTAVVDSHTADSNYSIHHPRHPPSRYSLTHQPLHTPLSSTGGIGRPLSPTSQRKAEEQRRELNLPQTKTMELKGIPKHKIAERLASGEEYSSSASSKVTFSPSPPAASSFTNPLLLNPSHITESDRFTPRSIGISLLQQEDRLRKQRYYQQKHASLQSAESRVLHSYEQEELKQQARDARSTVDKIQQRRGYMESLLQNYRQHEVGKRIHQDERHAKDQVVAAEEI